MGRKVKDIYILTRINERKILTSTNDILDIVPTDSSMPLRQSNNIYDYYDGTIPHIRIYQIVTHSGVAYFEGIDDEVYNKFLEFKAKRDQKSTKSS